MEIDEYKAQLEEIAQFIINASNDAGYIGPNDTGRNNLKEINSQVTSELFIRGLFRPEMCLAFWRHSSFHVLDSHAIFLYLDFSGERYLSFCYDLKNVLTMCDKLSLVVDDLYLHDVWDEILKQRDVILKQRLTAN